MKKQTLLLTALAATLSAGAITLPEGVTELLPAGVKANLSQTKKVNEEKNLCVAGSPSKGYYAFFSATDATNGEELWITDGTPAGTRLVKDINPGDGSSDPRWLTRFNDKVVFSANDGENGQELWISDGTEEGTYMVKDIHEMESSSPLGFCQLDETHMVFFAMDFESETLVPDHKEMWLWKTDGTEEGTELVKQVDGLPGGLEDGDHRWGSVCRVGRKVFFIADDADKDGVVHGWELWVTDGSENGTFMVKDINLEVEQDKAEGSTKGAAIAFITNYYNEKAFFKAWSIESGNEPWATDGTEAGTYQIDDINPTVGDNGLGNGGGPCITGEVYKGELLMRGNKPGINCELYVTNMEQGQGKYFDIQHHSPTANNASYPDGGVVFDDVYIFCAATGFNNSCTEPDGKYVYNWGTKPEYPNSYGPVEEGVGCCHGGELHCYDGEKVWMQNDWGPGTACDWVKEPTVVGGSLYWWNEAPVFGNDGTSLCRLNSIDSTPEVVININPNGNLIYMLRNLNGDLLCTSGLTKQIYCYHYRQPGYDPTKNPDVMEPEFRTREEIAQSGIFNVEGDAAINTNAPVEYYNLQGIRLAEPTEGTLVIRRQGTKAEKVKF